MLLPRLPLTAALALALAATACSSGTSGRSGEAAGAPSTSASASSSATTPSAAEPQVLASGLEAPWGLAFLPGGDGLVSERDSARVLRLPAAGGTPTEVARLTQTRPSGEGGLLGLAVSPSYAQDGLVYAYLTAQDDNRIVRFRLADLADGGEPEPVLTGIPKGGIHNGGRLAFGPDGALYAGTGDTGDSTLSHDPDSLGGKVLRMTPQGRPVRGASSLVFSDGHRNVQGLAFDAAGRLWASEFGQNRYDEINQVDEGDDGGWPDVEGPGDGGGRFAAPLVSWTTDEASPSGIAVAGGALYAAALRGERLWRVPLDGQGGTGEPEPLLQGGYGRLRAVAAAPDGTLWVLTSNRDGRGDPVEADDRVLRLTLPGAAGSAPKA